MKSKSTKSYRHCPGEEYEISIFICRGRQKAHYPKCSECEYRTTTEEIPPIQVKKETIKPPLQSQIQTSTGSIMVKSEPPSAVIYLDDDNVGVTPAIITQILPGKYKVKIKMDGYNAWSQSVDVKANKETSLTAVLQGKTCSVIIESKPTKAEVFIDGNDAGVTPVTVDNVKPGKHLVEVKLDEYETWSKEINVEAETETSLTADLSTKYGSISLDSEPTKAKIFLDGIEISDTPASLRSVPHGTHLVEVRMDGYNVWEKSVNVEPGKESVLTAILQVKTGSVSIKSQPKSAEIYLDGKYAGKTPASIPSVIPGIHEIKVEMDNYDIWSETVNIEAGKENVITAALHRSTGSLMIESDPANATIFVNGKEVGNTPDIIMSSAKGTHTVEVKMDGYDIWKEKVVIEPGTEKSLTAVLQLKTGSLNINSKPSGGTIFLDGEEAGKTPEKLKGLKLGTHQVEVKMDGYEIWSESVVVNADKENKLTAVLQILTGSLNIKSKPVNATIIVDGNEVGSTPAILTDLVPGKHLVAVRTEGYVNWSESVEVSANKENQITAVLQQLTGSLSVKSEPANATIIVDSNEVGNTPANLTDLVPGKHLVEVRTEGYGNWSESVEISADKENQITAVLQQLTGSLSVKSEPANAIIIVDGNEVGSTPAILTDLVPGKHLVEVRTDGYESWSESVEICADKENQITVVLQQLTGSLNVKSEPANAIIIVDGNEAGNTPASITDLVPGKHLVEIRMEGYEDWSESVNIEQGKETTLTAVLQLKSGSFTIKSVPSDAMVFIDGKEVDTTPLTITDPGQGKHSVEVKMDGFETWSESINIVQGEPITLTAALQIKAGTFSIFSKPSEAVIFIDGKEVGTTPVIITDPSPGTHTVEVKMDGFETWNESVDIEPGKEISITADLQMKAGSINVNSNPSEATIYIDGKKVGKTPGTISDLSSGMHLVEVIMDRYEPWSKSVDVRADKTNTLTAKLHEITGSINVESNPPEATIYLDGEKIGTTPDSLTSVAIGTHEVEIKMEGYAEWKKTLKIKNGKELTLNVVLQSNTGTASIDSDPAGAVVLLDGKDVGKTPVSLTGIKIGMYEVELQKDGYVSWKKMIKIKAAKTNTLAAKLIEMTGSVNIDSIPSNTIIQIDGKKRGNTPATITGLSAGKHQMEVKIDGYEIWCDSVNIEPGKEIVVTAELQMKPGAVSINSDPSSATILIDSKEVGTTPKIITDLSFEKHLVEVRMDGYESWSKSINIEPGIEFNVTAELQMNAGSVSINSEPSNAMILIDSKKAGTTPKTLTDIEPGRHQVEIRMEGYGTWSESVEVRSEKENEIAAVLHEITGSINIESNPPEATIYLDGEKIGATPDTIRPVAIGTHEIEIKMEGHAEWKKKLNIKKGKEIALNAVLQPITGTVRLESDPTGAMILLDGENVGKTPKIVTGIETGKHEVEMRLNGYDSCVRMIKIKAGRESIFSSALQRRRGSLMLISNPPNATIYIEGKKSGKTPRAITELMPGNYTVEVKHDEYQTWSKNADVVSGEEITIEAVLQAKPGSISIKSMPSEAKILIDGNEAGTTPETINDIERGTHVVELMVEGYELWSENVEVEANKESYLTAELQEMTCTISIKSEPSNAMVLIDGNEAGVTPVIINDLNPGTHMVDISMDGYNVWSENVEIEAKKEKDLTAILQEMTCTVTINSIPAGALILIDGKEVGITPITITDIKAGTHLVEASIDGYEHWSESIEVADKEHTMTAALQEITGSIDIESEPSNATILVSGSKIGLTPGTIKNLKPGMHQVEVRLDGFEDWSDSVEVTAEKESIVTALLKKATGSIIITSTPVKAKIYMDGEEVGTTPATLSSILVGIHEIEIKSTGHEDWKKSITVKKDKEMSLNAVLQLNIGSISIESYPEKTKIKLDGRDVGNAPKRLTDIIVGIHEIEVLLDGYVTWKKTIKVKAEKEVSLTADLEEIGDTEEIKADQTMKTAETVEPTALEIHEIKPKSQQVTEKPISQPPRAKPSSSKEKTKYSPDKLIKLRSTYDKLSDPQIESLPFITINEKINNVISCHSSINHRYEVKPIGDGDVVIDHTTELMWYQSGSSEYFSLKKAEKWLRKTNKNSYAGFDDWRLPTLEEASSLLELETKDGNFVDPVFDNKQWGTWTGDKSDKGYAWIVTYVNGTMSQVQVGMPATFVRPVRSLNI